MSSVIKAEISPQVIRQIAKTIIPDFANIDDQAVSLMESCMADFVSTITSAAKNKAMLDKRTSIDGSDILYACESMGYEEYSAAIRIYVTKYRAQVQSNEKSRKSKFQDRKINTRLSTQEKPRKRSRNNMNKLHVDHEIVHPNV
eukprot:gene7821-10623_t